MADVHVSETPDFGNPWERLSDQEHSDDTEECTCTLSESDKVQINIVGQMLKMEREHKPIPEVDIEDQACAEEHPIKDDKVKVERKLRISESPEISANEIPDTQIALAWLITICFNIPLGVLAIVLSMKATKAYVAGNRKRGRRLTQLSLVASLGGIVLTVVVVMGVILYLAIKEATERKKRGYG